MAKKTIIEEVIEKREKKKEEEERKEDERIGKEKEQREEELKDALQREEELRKKLGEREEELKVEQDKQTEEMREKRAEDVKTDAEILTFISSVYTRLNEYTPDFNPLGYYVGDKKWGTSISDDGLRAEGIVHMGMLKKPMQITCLHEGEGDIKNKVLRDSDALAKNNQFAATCYVVKDTDETTINFFNNFRHPNQTAYLYELSGGRLVFNEDDDISNFFAGWFHPEMAPRKIEDVARELSDKEDIFNIKELESKLNLVGGEAQKFIDRMIDADQIIEMNKTKGEYAFI